MNTRIYKSKKSLSFRMTGLALTMLTAFATAFSACGKKSSDPAPDNNGGGGGSGSGLSHRMEVITTKTWKITAATITPAMNGSTDYYSRMEACDKDNTYKFNTGTSNILVINEGAMICSGKTQTRNSAWTVNANEDIMTMGANTHKIVAFIDTQFETETHYEQNGMSATIAYRFTAQ